jgi:hypothetical protein
MSSGKLMMLPVDQVELDRANPRIRRFLEIHVGEPTYEQIALALDVTGRSSADEAQGATTPEKLKNSILQNGGIMQPIIVNRQPDGRYICIEGNTRLFIYRAFVNDETAGDWTHIPSLVHDNLASGDVDAIRLQAHLVGPRPWDAYSKAKYLWELQHKQLMPLERIVALCGGNRRDVTQSIQAYSDMETYYRPLCTEDDYDTQNYSGFVEVQNNRIRDAIFNRGYTLKTFSEWIRSGKFKSLNQIRQLPRVLLEKRARETFIAKDIKAAVDVLEKPELSGSLKGATISQLTRALTEAVGSIQFSEVKRLRENPDDDTVRYILDAREALQELIDAIGQGDTA